MIKSILAITEAMDIAADRQVFYFTKTKVSKFLLGHNEHIIV